MPTKTLIIVVRLEELIDEFSLILADPRGTRVAFTDAQASVLANARMAFEHQRQVPIPSDTSAARGAFVALQQAAFRAKLVHAVVDGDHQPAEEHRIDRDQDERGMLNPMRLFDERDDLSFGLYALPTVVDVLREHLGDDEAHGIPAHADAVFVSVEETDDWETWMNTFAR